MSNEVLFLLLYSLSTVSAASTPYCIWGSCEPSQYCCGNVKCCDITAINTILWGGIGLGAAITLLICLSCFCCNWLRYKPRVVFVSNVKKFFRSYIVNSESETTIKSTRIQEESVE